MLSAAIGQRELAQSSSLTTTVTIQFSGLTQFQAMH